MDKAYHFDRIRINSKKTVEELESRIPFRYLRTVCKAFEIKSPYLAAKRHGFLSRLEMTAPSEAFLKSLFHYDSRITPYSISHLEIACDTYYPTERDAVSASVDLAETLRKKWSAKNFVYDRYKAHLEGEEIKRRRHLSKGLLGDLTLYHGGKRFEYKGYARLSKINKRPCVHQEWKIQGATVIRQKTGIDAIGDLVAFKPDIFFADTEKRFIVHEDIDCFRIGKWLLGWGRRRKFTEDQIEYINMQGNLFCMENKIETSADLITFFRKERAKIKKKRGRRSDMDQRFLSAKYHTFVTPSKKL